MNAEKLLILAIAENAPSVIAEIMNSWLAEYIEGYMDKSGELFNKYFPTLPRNAQEKTIHTCLFESLANKLARKYNFTEPWKQVSEFKWEYIGKEKNPYEQSIQPRRSSEDDC